MDDRTYGDTHDCKGCRYWSEMVARSTGGGPMEAMCLSADGPQKGTYTQAGHTCPWWESGHYGPIDSPNDDVAALYQHEAKFPPGAPSGPKKMAGMYALVADMHAIIADIEGMKASNQDRKHRDEALAYPEQYFREASESLREIARRLREEI